MLKDIKENLLKIKEQRGNIIKNPKTIKKKKRTKQTFQK